MPTSLTLAEQTRMVAALRAHSTAGPVDLIETHISFVLLVAGLAYKVKKAVNLGFVDFSTLALRRHYCDEELRLNRRLAPEIYLDVMPVTGSVEQPVWGGTGEVIDWAVRMRAFAQEHLWDRLATAGALNATHIDALVEQLEPFYRSARAFDMNADMTAGFGHPRQVREQMLGTLPPIDALRDWEASTFAALHEVFAQRLRDGWVRECHGDLHLGNVTLVKSKSTVFDCLEFNPSFRWIDVMNDVAFMVMDLHAHGLPRLAHRFINSHLEHSGDYAGLAVLRYYIVYRALVRTKVAALRSAQLGPEASAAQRDAAAGLRQRYLDVALRSMRSSPPVLMLTHGFSGSGKTHCTQSLLELCGAIRIRADVERKRLFGLPATTRSGAAATVALYSAEATDATQARLREAAALALRCGYHVLLDATYLERQHRELARAVARAQGAGFVIIDFQASAATLRARVARRARDNDDASDADLAVLESQRSLAQPLSADELPDVFVFDAESALDDAMMVARWAPLLPRILRHHEPGEHPMALSDEVSKLHELHRSGALSDEEFARAKAGLIGNPSGAASFTPAPPLAAINALRRSRGDRWIAGVCGGIARATGVDSWIWRLLFALFLLWGGAGLLLYVLMWIFVPDE